MKHNWANAYQNLCSIRSLYSIRPKKCKCKIDYYLLIFTGQCPVSVPTIISSTSSEDVCRVVSQKSLSYTCNNDDLVLVWSSSIFTGGSVSVAAGLATVPPSLTGGSGVTVMITNDDNTTCIRSDLTFNGSLLMLRSLLNGVTLSCTDPVGPPNSTIIEIPSKDSNVFVIL